MNLLGATISDEQIASLSSFSGTLPDGTTVGVPEPSNIIGLGLLATFGVGIRFKKPRMKV